MKVIVTGATGMVGLGVLYECLEHQEISEVLSISRKPTGLTHPKLKELLHENFEDFSPVEDQLKGYDACFHSMGVSSAGKNEEEFSKYTFGYTMALAQPLVRLNPNMTFTYVSGKGTDSSEKGKIMWARVKGKTENTLLNLGFKSSFMFRPNAIIPLRGIKSNTKLYQFLYDYFIWLIKFMKIVSPNSVVDTTQIGLSMIHCALHGYDKNILESKDIILAANHD